MPKIQLMVVQATPFCNIDCKYCYLPDRKSKAVVSHDTLTNLFTQIFDADMASDDDFTVIWHAGEPMVLPVDFYREAFRLVDRLKPAGLRLTHSFQTNGTLITDEWCDFFRSEKINLGVSIDGPKRFHDRNRLTRSGLGTFDKTIAGIRRLRRNDVPFHVISVLSTASLAATTTAVGHGSPSRPPAMAATRPMTPASTPGTSTPRSHASTTASSAAATTARSRAAKPAGPRTRSTISVARSATKCATAA